MLCTEINVKLSFLKFFILGTCFVGNQSDKALLSLVTIPMLIYWMISCGYLLTGYLKKKSFPNLQQTVPAHVNGMGSFLLIYNVPAGILLATMFYLFGNRENWLNIPDLTVTSPQKAPLWLYILHSFLELFIGVLASAWAIGPRIVGLCKSNKKKPTNYKAPRTIKMQPIQFHAASYQTICPPNSMVSSVSIGTLPKVHRQQQQHIRKSPASYTRSHHSHVSSYANKSARSYRASSSNTMSFIGSETVL